MKSLTIYLEDDDYPIVKSIVEEKRTSFAQWYRELTQLGIRKHKQDKLNEQTLFLNETNIEF